MTRWMKSRPGGGPRPRTAAAPDSSAVLVDRQIAGRMLSVSGATIDRLVKSGKLSRVRIGRLVRYHRAEVASIGGTPWPASSATQTGDSGSASVTGKVGGELSGSEGVHAGTRK